VAGDAGAVRLVAHGVQPVPAVEPCWRLCAGFIRCPVARREGRPSGLECLRRGWQLRQGTSLRFRRKEKGGSKEDSRQAQGLGISRGGLTTKLHLLSDRHCRPLAVVVHTSQRHDSKMLPCVLDAVQVTNKTGGPRKRPDLLLADKGYAYPACRNELRRRGVACIIPERKDQKEKRLKKGRKGGRPCQFDKERYKERNVVERCILRLKQFRRIATRYDKTRSSYQTFATFASLLLWLRS